MLKLNGKYSVLYVLGFILIGIFFMNVTFAGGVQTIPNMPIGQKFSQADGLNVTWTHIPTYNLTKKEFILDVSQLPNSSTSGTTRTISPLLYLSQTNFNVSNLNVSNLKVSKEIDQAVSNSYIDGTYHNTCSQPSSIQNFAVWDGTNPILYNVGDLVNYNNIKYKNLQQVYNYNGVPPSLTQYWKDMGVLNSTNSTWNYAGCNTTGQEIIYNINKMSYPNGIVTGYDNLSSAYTIITHNISYQDMPVSQSQFKSTFMDYSNNQGGTQVGNITLNQMVVPKYSTNYYTRHVALKIIINNLPIDQLPTGGIKSSGTFSVNINGNNYWDKTHSSWWNTTFLYKRQINFTANVGQFSYLETIPYSANMNADFSDLRFVDTATETTEYNYTIESYTASTSAIVRIYSQGASSVMMYYGNPSATTTSSASNTYFNPVSMYYLDGSVNDALGVNNGTNNGATSTTGKIGTAYQFSGTTGYFTVADSPSLDLTTGMTISYWAYIDGFNNWGDARIDKGGSVAYLVQVYNAKLESIIWTSNGIQLGNRAAAGGTTILAGQWYYFTATYDGTSLITYVNGVLDRTALANGTIDTNTLALIFGGASNPPTVGYNGKLDEVAIYNTALTSTQISDLYQATAPTFTIGTESGQPSTNSCTYSGTGNWAISSSDFCNLTTNINMNRNNITITGEGTTTVTANITNWTHFLMEGISSTAIAKVICRNGGCFK